MICKNKWRTTDTLALPPTATTVSLTLYLYLFTGDITQKGYEKKRSKLIRAYAGGNLAKIFPYGYQSIDLVS